MFTYIHLTSLISYAYSADSKPVYKNKKKFCASQEKLIDTLPIGWLTKKPKTKQKDKVLLIKIFQRSMYILLFYLSNACINALLGHKVFFDTKRPMRSPW